MTALTSGTRHEPRSPDDVAAEPSSRPGFLYRRSGMLITQIATLVLLLLAWEWYAADKSIGIMAPPSKIAEAAYRLVIVDQELIVALAGSILMMFIGMGLAVLVGIPLGILMGRSKIVENVLDPYVMFLYVLPSVAFVPVLVVMLGIDVQLRIALIFLSGVFPLMINVIAGVHNVDKELVDGGKSFCASELQIMRTIILPASIPFIFAGFRLGLAAAWVGAIVAEMTAIITGVGGLLLESASRFRTADVFVAIFGIMIIAVAIQVVTSFVERRITPWRRAYEQSL